MRSRIASSDGSNPHTASSPGVRSNGTPTLPIRMSRSTRSGAFAARRSISAPPKLLPTTETFGRSSDRTGAVDQQHGRAVAAVVVVGRHAAHIDCQADLVVALGHLSIVVQVSERI